MIRPAAKALALLTPLAMLLGLSAPAQAATDDLPSGAKRAVAAVAPAYKFKKSRVMRAASLLDGKQKVQIQWASFVAKGKVIVVVRSVGAVRPVTASNAGGRVLATREVQRKRAGTRKVVITSTADEWGPGLTVAEWTERTGVNYQVISRGALGQAKLLKVVKAVPANKVKPSSRALSTIKKAKPAPRPMPESALRNTSNLIVDGAEPANDDLHNEATLCNGCAYSTSHYTGMWQWLLYWDGRLAWSAIDCQFGPATRDATKRFQKARGLAVDGIVGLSTRGAMDNFFKDTGTSTVNFVNGSGGVGSLNRPSPGHYWLDGVRVNYSGTSMGAC